jgi:hypothetical protein
MATFYFIPLSNKGIKNFKHIIEETSPELANNNLNQKTNIHNAQYD